MSTRRAAPVEFTDPNSHRVRDQARAGRWESPAGFVSGVAFLAIASATLIGTVIALTDRNRDLYTLATMTVIWATLGGSMTHLCRVPRRLKSATAFVGMVTAFATMVAAAVVTYVVLGTFDHPDDAVFEAVAGFTTTATSVVGDPERLSHGVLAFRAATQWIGGLAALIFVVALLPSMGVGGIEVTQRTRVSTGTSLNSRRTITNVRRLAALYSSLTGAGFVLFLIGGMPPFDALTYAATTISTGGFANHRFSFGHFDSSTIEWAGVGGMFLGGANLVLLYRGIHGNITGGILRSFELRAYLTVIVAGTALATVLATPDAGLTHDSVRSAAFHVTSAVSTTGHYTVGWAGWEIGAQVLLLALLGIGSMSGSAGGGFRLVRALALVGYLRREAAAQLYPNAVVPVRVGLRRVSDEIAFRMIGYQAQYMLLAAGGAFLIALFGADLLTATSASISAVANMGPALGDLAPIGGRVLDLPRPARASMLPLMFLGRLEIAPALVGMAIVGTTIREERVAERGRELD